MKIMILGNDANVSTLVNKLAKEKSVAQIYVSMPEFFKNEKILGINADCKNIEELINFAKEQKIVYTIILDNDLLMQDASRRFSLSDLLVFSPDSDSFKVCHSKSTVKKLAYKLKIPTPKFGVYDKESQAISAIRDFKFPFVIKVDEGNFYEICETYSQAKKVIQNLFFHDYKKIVLEQYIEGEYFSFYVVSDGYDVIPFGAVYSYVNPENSDDIVTIFPYNKIDEETEAIIARDFIFPIIDEFNANENVFLGILGLDLIITKNKQLYLLGLNNFFKKFDAQAVINAADMEISTLFLAAAMFSLRDKFDYINLKDRYFSSFKVPNIKNLKDDETIFFENYKNSNIACVSSSTMNGLTDRITDIYGD